MQARAIRRAGELLKQIMPNKGGRPELTQGGAPPSLTRKQIMPSKGGQPELTSVGTGTSLTKNQHDSIACVGTDTTSFCKAGLGT